MESATITYTDLDRRVRTNEVTIGKQAGRIDNIEQRLDRAARAFYFAGTSFIALAGVVVGAILTHG